MKILANQPDFVRATSATWQECLKAAIRDVDSLLTALSLDMATAPDELRPSVVAAKHFETFVPLPFLDRMHPGDWHDPLLLQVLPVEQEVKPGTLGSADPNQEQEHLIAPGILKKYQSRALIIAARSCAVNCRYCFRREFPYDTSPPKLLWGDSLNAIEDDPTIEEVILSGGDPLMNVDSSLLWLIRELETIPHVRQLRIHTRMPIVIPQRIDEEFTNMLSSTRLAKTIVFHSNHANEWDDSVAHAVARLKSIPGLNLLNQSVLLRGINDNVDTLKNLSWRLLEVGVLPYYLHQFDQVKGGMHFEVPVETGKRLIANLARQMPGYAVPRYVKEIPGEPGKSRLA
ncbi:MAG: EF-P beta-lysylation protein EpmB [Pirellulaceae bacterium]